MISPTRRRRILVSTGTALVASGLVTSGLALAPAVAANAITPVVSPSITAAVDDGILDWGMKESFRAYVEGPIADGEITMDPPATRNADGTFRFPQGTGSVDPDAGTADVAVGGGVHFYGHVGALDFRVDDLRLVISGGSGEIKADVTSSGEVEQDISLVSIDLGGQSLQPDENGVVTITGAATTLTDEGAPAFGGFYEPGTAMDPLSFTATVEGGDPTTPPTTTPPTTTPPTTTPPTTEPTTTPTSTQTPPPPPPDPSPSATWEEGEVSSGLLEWGLKESFRSYIAGPIAGGGWTTSGVGESGGIFSWTSSFGDYDMDAATGSVGFSGSVRFTGHDDALDMTFARPRVRFDGGTKATLILDVRSKSLEGEGFVEQASVEFATLDLGPASSEIGKDKVSYAGITAALTSAGAEGFGGFYEAGTELDPVTIAFAVGGAAVPGGGSAGGPGGGLAGTGADDQLALGIGGLLLLAIGGGLVVAGRRLQPTTAA